MFKGLFTAATGLKGQQLYVDTIANNLANVNKTGFKRSQIDLEDLVYESLRAVGTESAAGFEIPAGLEVGSGVRAISTRKDFRVGMLQHTGRPYDVAIQGSRGFFRITRPDGSSAYTRDGSFRLDRNGALVNANGYLLSPEITVPNDTVDLQIAGDGTVTVTSGTDRTTTQNIGQIGLYTFANPAGLRSAGGNLYDESVASGTATQVTPGQQGTGELRASSLERSNVEVVTELVNLIIAQRAYEVNSRAIRTSDEMLAAANNFVR